MKEDNEPNEIIEQPEIKEDNKKKKNPKRKRKKKN